MPLKDWRSLWFALVNAISNEILFLPLEPVCFLKSRGLINFDNVLLLDEPEECDVDGFEEYDDVGFEEYDGVGVEE